MLVTVVTVFAICWCPMLSYNVFYFHGVSDWLSDLDAKHNDVYPFVEVLTYVNSCLNPFLYAFFSQ